jgi:Fe-S-cluster-containing dehydrogenase component
MPYSRVVPEDSLPGKPLFYATSFPRPDGGAEGLLVETHEGRPTKIEGNPLHPMNQGKPSIWALASIMGLYDPDRLKYPVYKNPARNARVEATWDDFKTWSQHFAQYESNGGEGLAVLIDKKSSPSRAAAIAAFRKKFPKARWVPYSPAESVSGAEGTRLVFGVPMREVLNMSKERTRIIVSLDRDFLHLEPGEMANSRQFASTRLVMSTKDTMSRLYCVESGFSLTGAQADHRLRLSPTQVTAFARALAAYVLPKLGSDAMGLAAAIGDVSGGDAFSSRFVEECGKDLLDAENRGKSLILAGPSQPPEIHALVAALNAALGNIGQSIGYLPMTEEEAADSAKGIAELTEAMAAGEVSTLICINTNPLYDGPAGFAEAFAKVPTTITLSVESTETAAASTWSLNAAHYLESWGDTQSHDGVIAPIQPMIAPLYEPAMSDLEFITWLTDRSAERVDGYEVVRNVWRGFVQGDFEAQWRRALHDGVLHNTQQRTQAPRVNFEAVAEAMVRMSGQAPKGLEVVFQVGYPADGRYANVAWLQELPQTGTRTVWDNPILMSPQTAAALNLEPLHYKVEDPNRIYTKDTYPYAQMATITINGRSVTAPVWILPGMADQTVILTLGYGRQNSGLVGDGVGFNFYPLKGGRRTAECTVARAGGRHLIASTQNHWSMEGRTSIVRAVDLPRFQKFGDTVIPKGHYLYGDQFPTKDSLNFAEQLGELSHTPPNRSIYLNPFNNSKDNTQPESTYSQGPQWAMTIDQTLCTGCGACTLACQAENNIPVVGKKETAKGREMTWIRVDRYYTGDVNNPDAMFHQPVACVHCENAPCETVCPVNATVHGPEGINYMTYNRCIGTRYCANNCPYKVRRFNFFDYGVTKFNGAYYGKELVEAIAPDRQGITGSGKHNKVNPNLIPPRLRQKLDEIERMQKNPNVTVRSRGVMEKCSYCIQRINAARVETKLANLPHIPDGFFQTACQQACPTNAITFGDQLLKDSAVSKTRHSVRSYWLLGYLNTRPRTSHMVRVMNPKRELCDPERVKQWDEPPMHGAEHSHPAEGHSDSHAYFTIPSRKRDDRGYALSLRVLGAKA